MAGHRADEPAPADEPARRRWPTLSVVGAAALAFLVGAVVVTVTLNHQDDQTNSATAVATSAARKADDLAGPVLEQCRQGDLGDARTRDGRPLCAAAAEVHTDPLIKDPRKAIGATSPTVTETAIPPAPSTVTETAPAPPPSTVTATTTAPPPPRATVTQTADAPPPATVTQTETAPAPPPATVTQTVTATAEPPPPVTTTEVPPPTTEVVPPPDTTPPPTTPAGPPELPTMTDPGTAGTQQTPSTLPIPNLLGPLRGPL